MMYLSLIITFLLILGIIVAGIQNTAPLELKFMTWKFQMSLTALIFYSSLVGAAILAVLTLPKLASKYFKVRRLNKEIHELKRRTVDV
jgi:uncharacterized integral membrane protein